MSSRIDAIQTIYFRQISRAAQDFGDHEGVGTPRITRWILQFEDSDTPLAVKILGEITYYSSENIRSMVSQLVRLTYGRFHPISRNRILFIPIGRPYEGSSVVARVLRDEIRNERQIKHMSDLERLRPGTFDALVFLDDFSGTGSTLRTWWDMVEPIVLPRRVPFAIALLVLNCRARQVVEEFANILCVTELDETYNVVSARSGRFTAAEKEKIIHYCRMTGCSDEYQLGFGDCGLLVAFKHLCPNNSLPILWHTCERWEGLFKRSGL